MAYYPREEQETIYNFDVVEQVWRVYTTYPPHIKRLVNRVTEVKDMEKDLNGNVIMIEGVTDKNCIRLFTPKNEYKQRDLVHYGRLRNITHRNKVADEYGDDLNIDDLVKTAEFFDYKCALSGEKIELEWDHVIPQSVLKNGGYYGNIIPLHAKLNGSKSDTNIFEWFEANRQRFELSEKKFNRLISFLAEANEMSIEEYKEHVYRCHQIYKVAI